MATGARAALLRKIADSAVSGGGNNIRDGRYRFAIKKLALEDKFSGTVFIAEFVVVAASKIPVTSLKTGEKLNIEPNEAGSDVSWVQLVDKHPSALGNIKGFALELFGETEASVSDDEFVETLQELTEKNAAQGMLIDAETYRKVTKENGIEITIPKWHNVSTQDPEKTRAWMESLIMGKQAPAASA